MAKKEIVNLATAASVGDDILVPCYVPGSTDPAQKVSGAQLRAAMVAGVLEARPAAGVSATDDGAGNVTILGFAAETEGT